MGTGSAQKTTRWTRRQILRRSGTFAGLLRLPQVPAGIAKALGAALGTFTTLLPVRAHGASAERQRPQPGDHLVFAYGASQHTPILADDLVEGAPPLLALPQAANGLVRDGSRLNQVVVLKLPPEQLTGKTPAFAADGIVVYSAVCTHTGCTVEKWNEATGHLICPCHKSEFEAANAARVAIGPAPKPLAMLPVRLDEGRIVVNGKFSRRVGAQPAQ